MKKNKLNKIVTLSIIIIMIIVALAIFILNYSKDSSSFSLIEKKWISDNANNVIDVSVYNDVPIFGENGNGIIFDYLNNFTDKYNVDFNRVSYLKDSEKNFKDVSFRVISSQENLNKNDILLYEDEYVLVSKKEEANTKDIVNSKVGVLKDDLTIVTSYLNNIDKVSYTPYDDANSLFNSISSDEIDYVAVPKVEALNKILENNLNIVYHISGLNKKYILEINKNKTLLNIMKKYNEIYTKENYNEDYRKNFLKTFFLYKKISEVEQAGYNSNSFTYGYVINMPYENTVSKKFVGTLSNYLSGFEQLADVSFKVVGYPSIKDLKRALSGGEVDVSFANYNLNGLNIDTITTPSIFEENIVVLATEPFSMSNLKALSGKNVSAVANTYISDYLTSLSIKHSAYTSTDTLLKNTSKDTVLVVDYETYEYYAHNKFEKFKIIYSEVLKDDYKFVIRDVNKNKTFAELFKYYVSSLDYKDYKYKYNTDYIYNAASSISSILKFLIIALSVTLILVIVLLVLVKKKSSKKKISKEEKFKFIDVMTSLKNRNYLNYNMKKWDDNVIYPQTIIIIDLNNIKYINDSHGHSEGDTVIKKAASILIVNQLENSDIIRTDGNEFLIYMVGYKEDYVIDYIRKLTKALKELPYGFGATMGYSMITDDVKTIDDAINEATLSMRESKEKQ